MTDSNATKLAALRSVLVAAVALIDANDAPATQTLASAVAATVAKPRSRGNQNYFEVDLDSTNLARVKYWKNTKVLRILFNSGAEYDYFDVPADVAQDLVTAPSAGAYHNRSIKNSYRYARV